MPQPSITRLEEILNGRGAAPTLQEVQSYLNPEVRQALHVSAAVEVRVREIDLRLRSDEARFQESLKSLLTPWRDELLEIDAAARSSIIEHATHDGAARCECWRSSREMFFAFQDKWADNRDAMHAAERLWDDLTALSTARRPPKDDPAAEALAVLPDLVADSVESLLVDALPFLHRRRR